MDEIETLESMIPFDRPVHMNAASLASVTQNEGIRVNDVKFVFVGGDFNLIVRNDRNSSEERSRGLPAFGAAANVVVENVAA